MDDTAMNAAKAMIRSGSSQLQAANVLRWKRYVKNLGTTQADFDELRRHHRHHDDLHRYVSAFWIPLRDGGA